MSRRLPVLPDVTIDDFAKCDMRVCKVLSCETVKKSDKLLKFSLDDGSGTPRQILSGIRKFYEPEQLVGKTVVAILNLPPRKMMGLESNGMLLSAVREIDGKEELHLMILTTPSPPAPSSADAGKGSEQNKFTEQQGVSGIPFTPCCSA